MSTDSTREAQKLLRRAKTYLNPKGWSIVLKSTKDGKSAIALFATVSGTRIPSSVSLRKPLAGSRIDWEKDFKLQMSTSPMEQVEAIGKGVEFILTFASTCIDVLQEVSDPQGLAQKRDMINSAGESWLRGASSLLQASNGEMSRVTPFVKSCLLMRTTYKKLDDEQCIKMWQNYLEYLKILASDYFRHSTSGEVETVLQAVIQTLSDTIKSTVFPQELVQDTTWMEPAPVNSSSGTNGKEQKSGLSKAEKRRGKARRAKEHQQQRKEAAATIGTTTHDSGDEHVQDSAEVKTTSGIVTPRESSFGPSKDTDQSERLGHPDQDQLSWTQVSKRQGREREYLGGVNVEEDPKLKVHPANPDETKVESTSTETTPTMPVLFIPPGLADDLKRLGWTNWYNEHFPLLSSKCSQNDVNSKEVTISSPGVTPSSSPIIKPDNTMEESQAATHSGDDLSPQNSEIMLSPSLPETPSDVIPNDLAWSSQYDVMVVVTHPGVDAPAAFISVPIDQMQEIFRSEYPGEGWQRASKTTTTSPGHQHVGPLLHMTPGGLMEVAYKGYFVSGDNRSQ
ncbi:hypothetical protein TREMEDRAFT_58035 [Tremella mesenterica DSM 1558]|uniref:uncharacterized protein n=1 Tax=Tremella mesenterica (strain ATCC 24925 / CBS 8224 / DSM 1558 / NBRC 9311 / NRRL Y-6157 / RJB 2259-6 / UBC 559-6) TaxID=578456 RepID=UPI0003F49EB6|nr:uncharacterized protein TREMEDRAFT_58035 [Tremella mesenterica DSM 1558]EIW71902.1 hypothetical protein TREMEDRAFT_58035 [Tremella mesenterica DSM 1558]